MILIRGFDGITKSVTQVIGVGEELGVYAGVPQKGRDSRNGKVQVAVIQATITK